MRAVHSFGHHLLTHGGVNGYLMQESWTGSPGLKPNAACVEGQVYTQFWSGFCFSKTYRSCHVTQKHLWLQALGSASGAVQLLHGWGNVRLNVWNLRRLSHPKPPREVHIAEDWGCGIRGKHRWCDGPVGIFNKKILSGHARSGFYQRSTIFLKVPAPSIPMT